MPLLKRCSTKAFGKNVSKCVREKKRRGDRVVGVGTRQCVAISYSVLRKACRVRSKKRMTPKQVVARGRANRRRR
jgi:hypothetical protein